MYGRFVHACVKGSIGTRSGISTMEGGYQRGADREEDQPNDRAQS